MSWIGLEEGDSQTRPRVALLVGLIAVALAVVFALVLAVRAFLPNGNTLTLTLYSNEEDGSISAQVQYACGDAECGQEGDRLFFEVQGEGVQDPVNARVGSVEIAEAVIRPQTGGTLVYYDIPPRETGYSIIDFPCSAPGKELQVRATVETSNGEEQASSTDAVHCPSK